MVTIRKFHTEDGEAVRSLVTSIMSEEFPQSQDAYPSQDLKEIERIYGGRGEAFFVAVNDDHVIGTVGVKQEDDRIALLRRIFVHPSYRNQRIGEKLIDYAIHFCKENGYHEVIFKTSSKMDKAIRLCERKGFQQRAKLPAGNHELVKFVLFLGERV